MGNTHILPTNDSTHSNCSDIANVTNTQRRKIGSKTINRLGGQPGHEIKNEDLGIRWIFRPLPVASFCINPDLIKLTDDPSHALYLPDRPLPGSVQEADEIQELIELGRLRDEVLNSCQRPHRERRGLSSWMPDVHTGRELGRQFDDESPDATYRMVLIEILSGSDWSLEAKAQMRMVLDATMYNARLIAWHYKWRSNRGISVTYRPRPAEIAPNIDVLYQADSPSYPSGHSTIAGAASTLLSQCFPQFRAGFDDLADNVGMSCLWAGVNYRSDHVNGMRLGKAVMQMLIEQLL